MKRGRGWPDSLSSVSDAAAKTPRSPSRSPPAFPAPVFSTGPLKNYPKLTCVCGVPAVSRTRRIQVDKPGFIIVSAKHVPEDKPGFIIIGGCAMSVYDTYNEFWEWH